MTSRQKTKFVLNRPPFVDPVHLPFLTSKRTKWLSPARCATTQSALYRAIFVPSARAAGAPRGSCCRRLRGASRARPSITLEARGLEVALRAADGAVTSCAERQDSGEAAERALSARAVRSRNADLPLLPSPPFPPLRLSSLPTHTQAFVGQSVSARKAVRGTSAKVRDGKLWGGKPELDSRSALCRTRHSLPASVNSPALYWALAPRHHETCEILSQKRLVTGAIAPRGSPGGLPSLPLCGVALHRCLCDLWPIQASPAHPRLPHWDRSALIRPPGGGR